MPLTYFYISVIREQSTFSARLIERLRFRLAADGSNSQHAILLRFTLPRSGFTPLILPDDDDDSYIRLSKPRIHKITPPLYSAMLATASSFDRLRDSFRDARHYYEFLFLALEFRHSRYLRAMYRVPPACFTDGRAR